MKRQRPADEAAAAPTPPPSATDGKDGHAACRARAGELEARLAASEAAFSEQGGRLSSLETRLAALEAVVSGGRLAPSVESAVAAEQGGRLAPSDPAAASEPGPVNEATVGDMAPKMGLEARLTTVEAEGGELRAALSVQGGRLAALEEVCGLGPPEEEVVDPEPVLCPFLERRRDFGAELPAAVLLLIMDRVSSSA